MSRTWCETDHRTAAPVTGRAQLFVSKAPQLQLPHAAAGPRSRPAREPASRPSVNHPYPNPALTCPLLVWSQGLGIAAGVIEICIDQPQLYFKVCTQQQINPFKPFVLSNCYRGLGISCINMGGLTGLQFWLSGMIQKAITGGEDRAMTPAEEMVRLSMIWLLLVIYWAYFERLLAIPGLSTARWYDLRRALR